MSDRTSEPLTQDLKNHQGEEGSLPRDTHWATMVSLYPDEFQDHELQEARKLLAQDSLVNEVKSWPLSKVREVQDRPELLFQKQIVDLKTFPVGGVWSCVPWEELQHRIF